MDSIVVSAELTLQDWRALQTAAAGRLNGSETAGRQWLRVTGFIAAFAAAFVVLTFFDFFAAAIDLPSLGIGAVIVVVAMVVNSRLALKRMAPAPNGTFLGSCTYELRGDGLAATRRGAHSFSSWSSVLDVTRSDAHVFVWIDRLSAYVIPGRALPEGVTIEALVEWIGAARARAPTPAPPGESALSGTAAAPTTSAAPARRRRFARLLDLASLIALRRHAVLAEPRQGLTAALATLLALGTWAAFDWWESGPEPVLYIYGLPQAAWYLLGGLAVAWVLAQASVPHIALARAIAVAGTGACLAIVYSYLGSWLIGSAWVSVCLLAVAVLYTLTYFDRAARALTGQAQPRAVLAAFGATAAFFWMTEALYVYPMMWSPGETAQSEEGASYHEVEPLLFAQRERVDAALAAVPSNDPAATELYFVGFAGYGEQKVFAEEIKFADRAVEQRYARRAGSILLLNDSRDVDGAPLATASTLRYALRGMAEKMTLDDDVLFLALSSHGSSDSLSVRNGALPLKDLSPAELAAALDEAGIQWRVIVISACYAGGFIEALQDPYTIVLAAAAPDRTSFGCSDERDLTYFGEALYRDALPTAASLRDAFAQAEQLVLQREAAESIGTSSQPMAFFGAELERRLAALE